MNNYLKYKNKYFNLRDRGKLKIMNGGEIKYECPEDYSYLCPNESLNFGLCVNNSKLKKDVLCNKLDDYDKDNYRLPIVKNDLLTENDIKKVEENKKRGNEKGYKSDNLLNSCYIQKKNPIIYNYDNFNMPNVFSIITLNIMGIYRGNESVLNLMKIRMKMLRKELLEIQPDILCFQEMSYTCFNLLYTKEIRKIYPYFSPDINDLESLKDKRGKDIEVFIMSKYPIRKVTLYELEGNLDYTNSLGIYEFDNLVIFNVYMQAGSKKSPGQEYYYQHYSRCRSQELNFIKSIIDSLNTKPCIVLGDFNFDINGSNDEWPEKIMFNNLGLIDSWTRGLDENGLTENTDKNDMRYNSKFEEKKYRYDAILHSKTIELLDDSSKVICNEGLDLEGETYVYNEDYKNAILSKYQPEGTQIRSTIKDGKEIFKLFISDHFAVYSKFRLKN